MVVYNFKSITVVPTGKEFVDIILSKTQRKTPTVVHPQYQISRIRQFYMRKVKYASQNFEERITMILEQFPILDDLHPFYGDLLNILYDKDHYKLALGQLNTARHLIENVGKDYLKLLKYGDSLYRCKQLKRSALGRMCTIMLKQQSSLAYLEQVRQHLSRLPSIDPNARTLILCGYPNVGKSSFMNKVTRANVEVQPYPFTTKSLFVGHCDYEYLRWQVIDTPGILDHPLDERNTIEMQSITALAHLRATIIYVIDISEQCGYSIKQQVALFHSIKPLFANKPILLVVNKIDVVKLDKINKEDRDSIEAIPKTTPNTSLVCMSTFSEEGVQEVKKLSCDKLLEQRVELKLKNKKTSDVLNRLHVAVPAPRDRKERTPVIPSTVLDKKSETSKEMDMEDGDEETSNQMNEDDESSVPFWERGRDNLRAHEKYQLKIDDWKYDKIPEILDGKNLADFIDPEILARLDELEKEEEERAAQQDMEEVDEEDDLSESEMDKVRAIRKKKKEAIMNSRLKTSHRSVPKKIDRDSSTVSEFEDHLAELGIDSSNIADRLRSRSRSRGRKRARSASAIAIEEDGGDKKRMKSRSKTPTPGEGLRDIKQKMQAESLAKKFQRARNKEAKKGEGDRVILNMKPKHLFSGKRKGGTTDRR